MLSKIIIIKYEREDIHLLQSESTCIRTGDHQQFYIPSLKCLYFILSVKYENAFRPAHRLFADPIPIILQRQLPAERTIRWFNIMMYKMYIEFPLLSQTTERPK